MFGTNVVPPQGRKLGRVRKEEMTEGTVVDGERLNKSVENDPVSGFLT